MDVSQTRERGLLHQSAGDTEGLRLHLGCGSVRPQGWVNIDGSWNARFSRYRFIKNLLVFCRVIPKDKASKDWTGVTYGNLVNPLPYGDATVSAVYTSHLLEHLYRNDAIRLVQECYRVLRKGGILRVVVPDLQASIEQYIRATYECADPVDHTAGDLLMASLLLRPEERPFQRNFLMRLYTSANDFHSHKWMYDYNSLSAVLARAGFCDIQRKESYDSEIGDIRLLENPDRINHGLCIEANKP